MIELLHVYVNSEVACLCASVKERLTMLISMSSCVCEGGLVYASGSGCECKRVLASK